MFSIRSRIIDDDNFLKNTNIQEFDRQGESIYGLIEIKGEVHIAGVYYDKLPQGVDVGDEILSYWFPMLLKSLIAVKRNGYGAFRQIETHSHWISFERVGTVVTISDLEVETACCTGLFAHKQKIIGLPHTKQCIQVSYTDLEKEVVRATADFLMDLYRINPLLLGTKTIKKIYTSLAEI